MPARIPAQSQTLAPSLRLTGAVHSKTEREATGRPVSRVLSRVLRPLGDHSSGTALADRLARPTRMEREDAPAGFPAPIPIRSCSRRGLPCRPCRQERGGLLPHPFTLTPGRVPRRFAFCGAIPRLASGGRYPPPCLRGARTFLQHCCQRSPGRPIEAPEYHRSRRRAILPFTEAKSPHGSKYCAWSWPVQVGPTKSAG